MSTTHPQIQEARHRHRCRARNTVLTIAATGLLFTLQSCSATSGGGDDDPCASLTALASPEEVAEIDEDEDIDARTGIVFEVDGSGSVAKRRHEVEEALRTVVEHGRDEHAVLSVQVFGATRSTVTTVPCLENLTLEPAGANGAVRERNRPLIAEQVTALAMTHLGERTPDTDTDPAAGLDGAADELDRLGTDGERLLVMATDFEPSVGCLVPEDGVATPAGRQVAGCDLPTLGSSDVVAIVGVGRSDPPPSTAEVAWWEDLATAACHATGATCQISTSHLPELG